MPEKQKPRDRKEIPMVLSATALTLILTLWNAFANHDRQKVDASGSSASDSGSVYRRIDDTCATPTPARNIGAKCMTVTSTRSS